MSRVAVIVDRGGGYRVVVGPLESIMCNVCPGETCHVIPDLEVQEPASVSVVKIAEDYLRKINDANLPGQRLD
jgi:hypothetical protein